jgi:hypothetical protein
MLTEWAFRSLWRRLLCLLTRCAPRVTGHCLQCGRCCREIVLCHDGRWVTSPRRFAELLALEPGYERLEPRGRDADGRLLFSCSWLGADRRCRCHEDRLPLCRRYPSPTLWLRGVDLPRSCGYRLEGPDLFGFLRGERPKTERTFDRVLDREREQAEARNAEPHDRSPDSDEES